MRTRQVVAPALPRCRVRSLLPLLAGLAVPPVAAAVQSQASVIAAASDSFVWLEEVESERALRWVRERNARSLGVLQGDPHYAGLEVDALRILSATDRIPGPSFFGEWISNFWQDASQVRGVWRRTTLESFRSASPEWTTLLDVDALARAENANWVFRGGNCLAPENRYCLVSLSDGGKDAATIREYDVEERRFIDGGFSFPEGKQSVAWVDRNTLLVAREWVPGEMTNAGYAFVVKRLIRGQPMERAREVFRGERTDVSASGLVLRDADGVTRATLLQRGRTAWESDLHLLANGGTVPLAFPTRSGLHGLVNGRLVFTTNEDWNGYSAGDLLAYDFAELLRHPSQARPELVLRPGPRESVEGVTLTRTRVVVALHENVRGGAYALERGTNGWTRTRLPLPENLSVSLGSASRRSDLLFLYVSGYLTPQTLLLADVVANTVEPVKASPERFDATGLVVEQHEATSADGTKLPYFLVRRADVPRDGSTPTLLSGYGGFQISQLPGFSEVGRKLWLERGGAYGVANTLGGGEFGPSWHHSAIGADRDRAHEDSTAVPMTHRPDLFNAVTIGVPFFDMLRYHLLLAGASWIGEYGNPEIPEHLAWIERYSPYQALASGKDYPEPFILTSTKDDRVHQGHTRKAVAKLESLGYPHPYL